MKKGEAPYLVQILKKSNLKPLYMAGYINTILRSVCFGYNSNHSNQIDIWGSCWGRGGSKTNKEFVKKVFKKVPKNIYVNLHNHYPGFSANGVCSDLKSIGYKNIQICAPDVNDHSKIFEISNDSRKIFFMIGSSNFSGNTYVKSNRSIDQTDVAFIKAEKITNNLLSNILDNHPTNNIMLQLWAHRFDIGISENLNAPSNESNNVWSNYLKANKDVSIINLPYFGKKESILKIIENKFDV